MDILSYDIIEQVIEPLLTWKESSNLCSCNKCYHGIFQNRNSRHSKVLLAKKEIDYMNKQLNGINNTESYTTVIQGISNLYSRMENKRDIYLRLPCLTVVALAQLSRIVYENSNIIELKLLLQRLQNIYSYTNGILLYASLSHDFTQTTTCAYNPTNGPCILHGNQCKKKWTAFVTHEFPTLFLTP